MAVSDSLDMFGAAAGLADQIDRAARSAAAVEQLPSADAITSVVVIGMGGSGIGGDVLAAIAGPTCPVPIVVSKSYECPAFVGPNTVVFASSFSGNTQETIEAATAAHERGARLIVLAHGGVLADLAQQWGVPHLPVEDGLPMPRSGIAAVSIPLLVTLDRLGLCEEMDDHISAAIHQVQQRIAKLSLVDSDAAVLARRIGRTLPIIYGDAGLGEVAALRWKGQFNENTKVAAFTNRVPELTHNELCGWGQHGDVTRQVFSIIELRHDFEHAKNSRRLDLVAEICEEICAEVYSVSAEGDGRLAQLFDLILQGDYVTLEHALQSEVDPGPIPILDAIKAAMA